MRKLLHIVLILLSVLAGGVFLYSAYTKLFPIQPFEYTIVEYIHLPWQVASIAARLLIGFEAGLGAMLLLNLYGHKKWALKAALATLIIFSLYLAGLWASAGNNVNCGCFGDAIWMSPAASLIKNAILIIVILLLLRFHDGIGNKNINKYIPQLLGITGLVLPFFLFPIPGGKPMWLKKDRYAIDFTRLYNDPLSDSVKAATPPPTLPANLEQSKHIIAFLSQACPHCRIAAKKMHVMKEHNPTLPFFMIIGGSSNLTDFWKATNAQNIPYTRLAKEPFLEYTGGVFPAILFVNNGVVEAKADYNTLNEQELQQWLKDDTHAGQGEK